MDKSILIVATLVLSIVSILGMMSATAARVYAQGSWLLTLTFSNVPDGWSNIWGYVRGPFGQSDSHWVANSVNPSIQFTMSNDQFPSGHNLKICASELGVEPAPCDIVAISGNDATYNWDFNAQHQCQSADPSSCSGASQTQTQTQNQGNLAQNLYQGDMRNLMPGGIWNHYNP
jgi:hypothetical protein